jgi:type IV secretory pathway VirB4 component
MNINISITTGLIYAINYHFNVVCNKNKILILDDLHLFSKIDIFQNILNNIFLDLQKDYGILLCNANFASIEQNNNPQFELLLKNITTKITMPYIKLTNNLWLNNLEISRLSKFSVTSRVFLFTQNEESIILELSISAFNNIVRILLSKDKDIEIWNEIVKEYPGEVNNWLQHLYNKFDAE